MNQERILTILKSPHLSEKATLQPGGFPQYIFKVSRDATKPEIKQAVESLFDVTVRSVSVVNIKGKQTRTGRILGRRAGFKKAYVVLEQGQQITAAA